MRLSTKTMVLVASSVLLSASGCGASRPEPAAPETPGVEAEAETEAETETDTETGTDTDTDAETDTDTDAETGASPRRTPPVREAPKACVGLAAPGEIREVDIDSDGSTDIWEVRRDGAVFCRETDLNFDGSADVVTFYGPDGTETRRESDLDFDGSPDLIEVRREGIMQRIVVETVTTVP